MSTVINDPLNFKVDGWNVIARRQWQDGNGFDKNWDEYSEGFSTPNKKGFWLGNKYVSKWTNARNYAMRVNVATIDQRCNKVELKIYENSPGQHSLNSHRLATSVEFVLACI